MADLQSIKLDFIADTTQLDKAITKTTKIEREIRKLAASVGKGAITNKQYENRVKQLASELQSLTGGNIAARNSVNAFSTAQYQAARATEVDTVATQKNTQATNQNTQAKKGNVRGSNELGVAVQQTGYQVGDFLVQVQSGTNVMVAFGQQATQLVGVLPLLSNSLGVSASKLIAISSGLGIAIPLATALGAAWMRTSKEVEDSGEKVIDILKRIKEEQEAVALGVNQEELKFIKAQEDAQVSYELQLQRVRKAQEAVNRAEEQRDQGVATSAQVQTFVENLELETDALHEQSSALSNATANLTEYQNARQKISQGASLDAFGGEGDLRFSPEGVKRSKEILDEIQQGFFNVAAAQTTVDNITESLVSNFSSLVEITEKNRKLLGDSTYEAMRLAGVDMAKPIDEAAKKAFELAQMLKVSVELAGIIGNLGDSVSGGRGQDPRKFSSLDFFRKQLEIEDGTEDSSSGSTSVSLIDRLQQRITLQEKSLTLSKAESQVLATLGQSITSMNDAEIAAFLKGNELLTARIEKLDEAKERQKEIAQVYDTMGNSMEEAIMSAVDGTKSLADAFRTMARDIIAELYQVFVVKQMVGSASAGTGLAGGLAGGLSRLLSFDGGGFTGSGPRSGGVDGKGGFPAILHPNETVVDHTKGQSSGGAVININNYISGNAGDKAIEGAVAKGISQAAPQIMQATKQSIIKDRRAGGVMKGTFG